MPIESLPSPSFIERAATTLEQALARIVAHFRAELASQRREMESDIRAATAELEVLRIQIKREQSEFTAWFAKMQEMRIDMRGEPGAPGKDGEHGKDGMLGERGAEGPQGRDGRDGMPGLPAAQGERGRDGIDGKDGLGFDDLVQFDEANNYGIRAIRDGTVLKEFKWSKPTLADFHGGPYRSGENYCRGQCATYGGSTFVCLRDTQAKPESEDWRLIVKHGLPGRNGKDGERGPVGPTGRDGRDLTQMTSGGIKYG